MTETTTRSEQATYVLNGSAVRHVWGCWRLRIDKRGTAVHRASDAEMIALRACADCVRDSTTRRTIRVSDDLWQHAAEIALARNETLSDVLRDALASYIADNTRDGSTTA